GMNIFINQNKTAVEKIINDLINVSTKKYKSKAPLQNFFKKMNSPSTENEIPIEALSPVALSISDIQALTNILSQSKSNKKISIDYKIAIEACIKNNIKEDPEKFILMNVKEVDYSLFIPGILLLNMEN